MATNQDDPTTNSDAASSPSDDRLSPSASPVVPNQQQLPQTPDGPVAVPDELVEAGHPTNEPQADSPESFDAAINQDDHDQTIDPIPSYPVQEPAAQAAGERLVEPLSEDNDTPFSAPDDSANDMAVDPDRRPDAGLEDTHQATDSNIEAEEVYDEGLSGAAEATEPNAGNAVTGYDPAADSRKDNEKSSPQNSDS